MKIKIEYAAQDDIPTEYVALYTENADGAFILSEVDGMKTQDDINRQQAGLTKERAAHKETKNKLAAYTPLGDDPVELQVQLDRIPELEAHAGENKPDENKMNELVEARMKSRIAPMEREKATLTEQLAELTTELGGLKGEKTRRTIHDEIEKAAVKQNLVPTAMADAYNMADRVFEITDDGQVVTNESHSQAGLSPETWFADIQNDRPHWWPASTGGGARGSNSQNGAGPNGNPWTKANWNKTEQGLIFKEKGSEVAMQLSKSAGSELHASKPPEK
jgi:hypothetical protein